MSATNADDRREMSPWVPMVRAIDKKHIGKLLEELGEATSAASRCFIQGIYESEPVTGKLNKEWLEDELADVQANTELCIEQFELNTQRMAERVARKKQLLRTWHIMLTADADDVDELSTTGEPYRGSPSDDADRAMKKLGAILNDRCPQRRPQLAELPCREWAWQHWAAAVVSLVASGFLLWFLWLFRA